MVKMIQFSGYSWALNKLVIFLKFQTDIEERTCSEIGTQADFFDAGIFVDFGMQTDPIEKGK